MAERSDKGQAARSCRPAGTNARPACREPPITFAREPARDARERVVTPPAEFDDILSWAVWLYYADQLTQNEIARLLGVSRASIVKLLQEARERGLVTIRINTESASRTRMSRALAERFCLQGATVIPSIKGAALTRRLGDAGARVLADQMRPGDVIGVAWGRTVLAVARSVLVPESIAHLTVVQLTGSSAGGTADFSPELCSSLLAGRLMARCVNLVAPAVLSTAELRDRLLEEPALVKQFALVRSANRVLFGVGDLAASGTVRQSELASAEVIDAYVRRGAVGALIGRFIDAKGRLVSGELDGRMVGLTLDELLTMPVRLCVAGGPEKIAAIRAALRGGFVTHFVTDMATCAALMRDAGGSRFGRGAASP